jgi:hypothetical protein
MTEWVLVKVERQVFPYVSELRYVYEEREVITGR